MKLCRVRIKQALAEMIKSIHCLSNCLIFSVPAFSDNCFVLYLILKLQLLIQIHFLMLIQLLWIWLDSPNCFLPFNYIHQMRVHFFPFLFGIIHIGNHHQLANKKHIVRTPFLTKISSCFHLFPLCPQGFCIIICVEVLIIHQFK